MVARLESSHVHNVMMIGKQTHKETKFNNGRENIPQTIIYIALVFKRMVVSYVSSA